MCEHVHVNEITHVDVCVCVILLCMCTCVCTSEYTWVLVVVHVHVCVMSTWVPSCPDASGEGSSPHPYMHTI